MGSARLRLALNYKNDGEAFAIISSYLRVKRISGCLHYPKNHLYGADLLNKSCPQGWI